MKTNVLYKGNCLDILKTIDDDSIDLIVTDPPYKVTSRGSHGSYGGMLKTKLSYQGKIFEHNDIEPDEYAGEFYRVLRDGTHCYIMTNHINLYNMLTCFQNVGFYFIKSLIWDKGNKISGRFYMSQFEYILFFRKGTAKQINNCGTSDILYVPNKKSKNRDGTNIHDTQKPIELMQILILNSSKENDIVLEPFAGSGSTCLACLNTNRQFIGIEIDDKYFDIANKRINRNLNFIKGNKE